MDLNNEEYEFEGEGNPSKLTKPGERIVNFDQFRNEIGYHEASHFVVHVVTSRHLAEPLQINYAICCAEKINYREDHLQENGYNVVNMGASKIKDFKDFPHYFTKDRRNLVASLLKLIAGYSSYQLFIENNEFYINSEVRLNTPKTGFCTINYRSLPNYRYCEREDWDFSSIQERLEKYYGYHDYSVRMKAIGILTNEAQKLMNLPEVKASIERVKVELLKNECRKIEGPKLEKLVQEVARLTNKINISEVLERLKDKIE